jgi:hypothetical protein
MANGDNVYLDDAARLRREEIYSRARETAAESEAKAEVAKFNNPNLPMWQRVGLEKPPEHSAFTNEGIPSPSAPSEPDWKRLYPVHEPAHLQPMPQPAQFGLDPRQETASSFQVFKNPLIWVGILGSLLTRRPALAAMAFAGGAMKGYDEGNTEVFNKNKEKFDEAVKQTEAQNRIELERYKEIWESDQEKNWQGSLPKLYAEAAKNGDKTMQQLLSMGAPMEQIEKYLIQKGEQGNSISVAIEKEREKDQLKQEEIENLKKDPNVIARANAIRNYEQPSLSTSGFAANNPYNQAVMSLVTEGAEAAGEPYETANFAAKQKFVAGLGATTPNSPGGRINAINTVVRHFGTLDRIIDDLGSKDVRIFNRGAQAMQEEFGLSEAPTDFDVARGIVANEMVKAVTTSGGGVTDRLQAQNEFDRANSPKLLKGAVNTARELIASQAQTLVDQAGALRATRQFDKMLPQATRDALQVNIGTGKAKIVRRIDHAAAEAAGWTKDQIRDYEAGKIDEHGNPTGGK